MDTAKKKQIGFSGDRTRNGAEYAKQTKNKSVKRYCIAHIKRDARRMIRSDAYYVMAAASCFILLGAAAIKTAVGKLFELFDIQNAYAAAEAVLCDTLIIAFCVPLFAGLYCYAARRSIGENPGAGYILKWWDSPGKTAAVYSLFLSCAWKAVSVTVVFAVIWNLRLYGIGFAGMYGGRAAFAAGISFAAAAVLAAGIGAVLLCRDFMVLYIAERNPQMPKKWLVKGSRYAMRGCKIKTLAMAVSFIPWVLLSFLTLGTLLMLFVMPYFTASAVKWAEYIYEKNEYDILYRTYRKRKKSSSGVLSGGVKFIDTIRKTEIEI